MNKIIISVIALLFTVLPLQTTHALSQTVYSEWGIDYSIDWDNSSYSSTQEGIDIYIHLDLSEQDDFATIQFVANSIMQFFTSHNEIKSISIGSYFYDEYFNKTDEFYRFESVESEYSVLYYDDLKK